MHRFFLNSEDTISSNEINILNSDLIHQLKNVLRFKNNQQFILINSDQNTDITVELKEISKQNILTKIIKTEIQAKEPHLKLNLHFPILKNTDKIELILQKCTELGVFEFTPIITQRTEKNHLPKEERLLRIIKEACEQCGRTDIPTLNQIKKFKDCLKNVDNNGLNLIANPYTTKKLSDLKSTSTKNPINLFIGPEGGFSESEIEQTKKNKFTNFQLGQLILRAETACIVATSQILI